MKNDLYIYTNLTRSKILCDLFYDYNVKIKKISEINCDYNNDFGLILLDNEKSNNPFSLVEKSKNKIIVSNKNDFEKYKTLENIVEMPIKIQKLRNKISILFSKQKFEYKDLKITDNKVLNKNNSAEIILTEVEKKILIRLFIKKSYERRIFKKEVLNIKEDIETNSLDSHLTRIRKKIKLIKSNVSIVTKNQFILIQ